MSFEHFPYTNFHNLNLDWVIEALRALETSVQDFVSINAIKYANPIIWNITSQYEKNTVVLDDSGNAYLSVQPVPSGVSLDRTDFWTVIGNFSALWESVKQAITPYDEYHNTTASVPHDIEDWVWVNDDLLLITSAMTAGDKYIVGGNCQMITIETLFNTLKSSLDAEKTAREEADTAINKKIANLSVNVKNFGALGDGATDDTTAIQSAIDYCYNNGGGAVYIPQGTYCISASGNQAIWLKQGVSLYGDGDGYTILSVGAVTARSEVIIASGSTNIFIRDLSIIGTDDTAQIANGILFLNTNGSEIQNVTLKNLHGTGMAICLTNSSDCNITGVYCENPFHGIGLVQTTGTCTRNKVTSCIVKNGNFAFHVNGATYNDFTNCLAFADTFDSLEGFNIDGGFGNSFTAISAYGRGDGGFVETNLSSGKYPDSNIVNGLQSGENKLTGMSLSGTNGIYNNIVIYNNGKGSVAGQNDGLNMYLSCANDVICNVNSYDNQTTATQRFGVKITSGAENNVLKTIKGSGNLNGLISDDNTTIKFGTTKFFAHNNGVGVSVPNGADTIIPFSTTEYNVGGCWADNKFTPTVEGVYNIKATVCFAAPLVDSGSFVVELYKNGSVFKFGKYENASGTGALSIVLDVNVQANGISDYFQIFVYQGTGSTMTTDGAPSKTYVSANLLE